MVAEQDPAIDAQKLVTLKLDEPQVDSSSPWGDDLLGRRNIATLLTSLVATQEPPLTISLNGHWGTGKTFLLKRWQKALENDGYKAIYFNAWEDDFSDDPLLSILGQLAESLNQGLFRESLSNMKKSALPLLRNNFSSLLNRHTGLTTDFKRSLPTRADLFKDYLLQHNTKDSLKANLQDLAAKVQRNSNHPLVFIIDELDRCRPTFAIELLERVKHIFDVPNLVFVLGLNRDELCNSIKSIYGEINADVYLRRFFDMEFNLPPADSEPFVRHRMERYALNSIGQTDQIPGQPREVDELVYSMPTLWSHLGLSLRDLDYCVRLIVFVGMGLSPRQTMYPWMLGLLIVLKLKNPVLYQAFVAGRRRGTDVMDFINESVAMGDQFASIQHVLDQVEAYLYLTDKRFGTSENRQAPALEQLKLLQNGSDPTQPEHLSQKTRTTTSRQAGRLVNLMERIESPSLFGPDPAVPTTVVPYVASLIDLHQDLVRR